ncbi:MAG: alkaline phosphatase family protein, partial [Flavisolibacter sp.]
MVKGKIEHVFVVMFENRSFDHMLGFSNIQGINALTGEPTTIEGIDNPEKYAVQDPRNNGKMIMPSPDAPFSIKIDPPHEFKDTLLQLTAQKINYSPGPYPSINNKGFALSYLSCNPNSPGENMKCFSESQLPILHQLAREFTICDHWHSSVPGPTWPNRFFLHAATSGGLDDSPNKELTSEASFKEEFNFQNGTIFDQLSKHNIPWIIYEGDEFSQSYSLKGMHDYGERGHLRPFRKFKHDLSDPKFKPAYIFIEPCYGYVLTDKGSFKCGNSQHPLDDVRRGEKLL